MLGFNCLHCHNKVPIYKQMGVKNRNHCPYCLWSKHVDNTTGDRENSCGGSMEPLGLTTKQITPDKWDKDSIGELMLIHKCTKCDKISINRIASDDTEEEIIKIFEKSQSLDDRIKQEIKAQNIKLLTKEDKKNVTTQLWGK